MEKMEYSADPFSQAEIGHFCYSTCNSFSEIPDELRPKSLPVYRDEATRDDFVSVGTFFGCMQSCENQYLVKRLSFIIPTALFVLTIIGTFICCWCCKGCALYKCRKRNKKNEAVKSLLDSSTSSLDHLSPLSSSSASTNTMDNLAKSNSAVLNGLTASSLYPASATTSAFSKRKRTRRIMDGNLNATNGSLSLSNSWVSTKGMIPSDKSSDGETGSGEDSSATSRKSRFIETASKLGRKLVAMDKQSDEVKEANRKKKSIKKESLTERPPFRF